MRPRALKEPARGHTIDRCRARTQIQAVWLSSDLYVNHYAKGHLSASSVGKSLEWFKTFKKKKMQAVTLGHFKGSGFLVRGTVLEWLVNRK